MGTEVKGMTIMGEEALRAAFREAMSDVATAVTVVTSHVGGVPHGTTVSAFASLSMTPPMVLVALDRSSSLLRVIRQSRRFGVNVLGRHQAGLGLAFARKGGAEKFDGVAWSFDGVLPRLARAPGWIACEAAEFIEGGDHMVVFGRVLAAEALGGDPLTYHARTFGTHRLVPAAVAGPADDWDSDSEFMRVAYCVG
jgi:flavin reductase (DIM6/NTAB) family NADH-FMN oxidoreductase RutF